MAVAKTMIKCMGLNIHRLGYREARALALSTYKFTNMSDEEVEAYKRFLDHHFNQRAVAATKLKHRPRTPLQAYEGDT